MAVFVDNMNAKFGRMTMCHMIADCEEELIEMALKIGVSEKWHQYKGTYKSHFDICLSKKELAKSFGAIEISWRELAVKVSEKRETKKALKNA